MQYLPKISENVSEAIRGAFKKFVDWRSHLRDTHIIFCHFST